MFILKRKKKKEKYSLTLFFPVSLKSATFGISQCLEYFTRLKKEGFLRAISLKIKVVLEAIRFSLNLRHVCSGSFGHLLVVCKEIAVFTCVELPRFLIPVGKACFGSCTVVILFYSLF